MQAKHILLIILSLIIGYSAEAQFLKKLKKKAEQAAERTILKKTDEIVTGTTEKTIDDVTSGSENKTETENSDITNTTSKEDGTVSQTTDKISNNSSVNSQNNPAFNPMATQESHTSKMPESYDFDWEFKTEMKTSNDESMGMNYLINSSSKEYFGMEIVSEELKGKGTMCMVTDVNLKSMIMFMDMNGQKMAQVTKITEHKSKGKDPEYSMKEIGTKTILGYTCYGMQVENADYIAEVYFTLDAPVNFSAFFAFANNKKGPKGFDPALLKVLEEDALLMEMTGKDKKKKNQSFTMTAISLEKKANSIQTKEYPKMGF